MIGPRNLREKKLNQDAVMHRFWKNNWCIAVCDGMGSKPLSHIGSSLACQSVYEVLKHCDFSLAEKEVAKKIYMYWLKLLKDKNILPTDAATTCLFAWGNRQGNVRLFQLGDGAIYYQSESFGHVGVKSDDLFSNQTNALGYSKKWDDWSYKEIDLTDPNHGIILMTDGISEDLLNERRFTSALIQKATLHSVRRLKKYIQHELIHWPTPQHSDDKSIGIVFWKK
ncbi:PP2C family serine/threonine-protein phosphatase [Acinetobacter towneri]|uniref:PPM-type phosphatase domain-containing protein n=1 Tax=Acinetobacter towneri TaxID=202956 RepID=A0A1E8E2S9_9GAMM|nr:PP2C family serine/threonine-protein phosphatase [Acinetobacter towneri]OFE43971.1 hypothetical protein BJN41_04460 [Acinetobacter towneri]